MIRIKYNSELMKIMSFFEGVTRTKLKDCLTIEKQIIFIVTPGQISKAIGKNAITAKKLQQALNRKIKIVEFNPKLTIFIANLILPLKAEEITEQEGIVTIKVSDRTTKGILIGRNSQNINNYTAIVKRYFNINKIKIV